MILFIGDDIVEVEDDDDDDGDDGELEGRRGFADT